MFTTLADRLLIAVSEVKSVSVFKDKFAPIYRVRLEFLDETDFPKGIAANGKYVDFIVNTDLKKVMQQASGVVRKSETELAAIKTCSYASKPITSLCKAFRAKGYKSDNDLIRILSTYCNNLQKELQAYTGGYPYTQGI